MKQYLLLCDDTSRMFLENVLKGVQFLEVQGMNVDQAGKLQVLATPIHPPVNPVPPQDPPPVAPQSDAPAEPAAPVEEAAHEQQNG